MEHKSTLNQKAFSFSSAIFSMTSGMLHTVTVTYIYLAIVPITLVFDCFQANTAQQEEAA